MASSLGKLVEKKIDLSHQEWKELSEAEFVQMIDRLKRCAVDYLKENPNLELAGTSPLGTDIGYDVFEENFYIRFFVKEKPVFTVGADGEPIQIPPEK